MIASSLVSGQGYCRQESGNHCASCNCTRPTLQSSIFSSGTSRSAVNHRRTPPHVGRRSAVTARMGIRMIESFDAQPELENDAKQALSELLRNPTFCKQVASETGQQPGTELEFAEMLFTPVPWSPATTRGMPREFEKYHDDPNYATINVPPNFMFQAKIFKPSRLCALYKKRAS